VKGMISATKSVGFIMLFLVLVMYVYSIIMVSIISEPPTGEGHDPESAKYLFGSMGDAMMTLFTNGVLGDNLSATVSAILEEGTGVAWIFWTFFGISSMTLLNMLIGVLCEVISKSAQAESDALKENAMVCDLGDVFRQLDANGDGRVTVSEWELMKQHPQVRASLSANGIEPDLLDEQLDKMQAAIFMKKSGRKGNITGLSLEEFVGRLCEIQPSKPASCLELQLLSAKFHMRDEKIFKYFHALHTEMAGIVESHGQVAPPEEEDEEVREGAGGVLNGLSTAELFAVLKSRTSKAPPGSVSTGSPSTPLVLQSAFPTPGTTPTQSTEQLLKETETGILHEDRVLARQHPLFKQLAERSPPGGWATARCIASKVETNPVAISELSKQAPNLSVAELQALFESVPELFVRDQTRLNETVVVRQPEEHMLACPRHASSTADMGKAKCQCAWRIADALLLFTEGSPGRPKGT